MYETAVLDPGTFFVGLGLTVVILIGAIVFFEYVSPYIRWNNYLQSYRIGKLVKHAAENQTRFVFAKRPKQYEIEEIDEQFSKEERKAKEIIEIENAYIAKE